MVLEQILICHLQVTSLTDSTISKITDGRTLRAALRDRIRAKKGPDVDSKSTIAIPFTVAYGRTSFRLKPAITWRAGISALRELPTPLQLFPRFAMRLTAETGFAHDWLAGCQFESLF